MAGPPAQLKSAWQAVGEKIRIDAPTPMANYLGCTNKQITAQFRCSHPYAELIARGGLPLDLTEPEKETVKAIEYDMGDLVKQRVKTYEDLAGSRTRKLKHSSTPLLEQIE